MDRTVNKGHAKLIAGFFRSRPPAVTEPPTYDVVFLPAREPGGGVAEAIAVCRNITARLKARSGDT
jgi:hypothetical protein